MGHGKSEGVILPIQAKTLKNMQIIITGTTGMVGKGTLLEAIQSTDVTGILLINRHSVGITHPKIKEILHKDFFHLEPIRQQLKGYEACLFCLGVSSVGMNAEQYRKLTFDLTTGFAKVLLEENPGMTFCYISGKSTDSTEKGSLMWARVKGETENALLRMGFRGAYMFRPGFIQPFDGVKAKAGVVNVLYAVFRPLYFLLKRMPGVVTNTRTYLHSSLFLFFTLMNSTAALSCIAICLTLITACASDNLSKRESKRITAEAQSMLEAYHRDLAIEGLTAEFKYLDSTDQFSWHPAGYDSPISYDSVAKVLLQLDDFYTSIKSKWDTLAIVPVSDTLVNYTGDFTTTMTDVTGFSETYEMHETGILIKRPDGWKMLSGKTTMMPRIK